MKLSTGREVYANREIIGLSPDGGVYQGYDGDISYPVPDWEKDEAFRATYLTASEMRELATIMIDRWTAFRDGLPTC